MEIEVQVWRNRTKEPNGHITSIDRETFFHHNSEVAREFEQERCKKVPDLVKGKVVMEREVVERRTVSVDTKVFNAEVIEFLSKKKTATLPKLTKVFGEEIVKILLA